MPDTELDVLCGWAQFILSTTCTLFWWFSLLTNPGNWGPSAQGVKPRFFQLWSQNALSHPTRLPAPLRSNHSCSHTPDTFWGPRYWPRKTQWQIKTDMTCPCLQGAHSLTHGENSQIWFDLWGWQTMGFGATLFYSFSLGFHNCEWDSWILASGFPPLLWITWRCV